MDKPKLFTVGPTYVNDDVRAEMSNQMFSHRDAEYVKLHKELIEKLRKFFQTQNDIFIYTSSSTGCMESSVRNCISEHGTGLSMVCGAFGKRFNEIIAENGRNAVRSEVPWGKANLGEQLEEVREGPLHPSTSTKRTGMESTSVRSISRRMPAVTRPP